MTAARICQEQLFLAGRQFGAGRRILKIAKLTIMKIRPFRIEEYFAKYEFSAKYLLSNSDMESRAVQELFALEPGSQEKFLQQWCGYTEAEGAPELREVIARIYKGISPKDTLVLSAAEEAIFVFYHALAGPGDHIIVETPCYESGLEVARSTGAQISEWRRHSEKGWAHDVDGLRKLIQPNTKIIYINTPHNPTGLLMPRAIFDEVFALAHKHGFTVFSDEVYRELEHDPATRLPAACEMDENAVSLGSMSKTYGLAGLRLGWLVSRNPQIIGKCLNFKYYTTISNSAPSEFLSALALRHREVLIKRNLEIVHRNLALLSNFFEKHSSLFEWTRPNASPIGFVKLKAQRDVFEFCEEVVSKKGVMLLPGTVYDEPRHIRFGYGRKNMPEALQQFTDYVQDFTNELGFKLL